MPRVRARCTVAAAPAAFGAVWSLLHGGCTSVLDGKLSLKTCAVGGSNVCCARAVESYLKAAACSLEKSPSQCVAPYATMCACQQFLRVCQRTPTCWLCGTGTCAFDDEADVRATGWKPE